MVFFALRIARSLAGKISSPFRRISTRLPPTTEAPVYATIAPANAGRPASDAVICIGGRTREHPARRQKVARPMSIARTKEPATGRSCGRAFFPRHSKGTRKQFGCHEKTVEPGGKSHPKRMDLMGARDSPGECFPLTE